MGIRANLYLALAVLAYFGLNGRCFPAEPPAPVKPPVPGTNSVFATNSSPDFLVADGFRLETVADDSQVSSPAAMAFDENGRLFVAEMRDYPDRREQAPHLGRIRLLEDTDGDGKFDRSGIFAENLAWPSAITCANGGIFVGATPEILFLKDNGGSGKADVRTVVFNGIGAGGPIRPDTVLNSFTWGPDNHIHVGTAGLGGLLTGLEPSNLTTLELGRNDFAFDPHTMAPTLEPGTAQSGMCFDEFGRRFFCGLARPLRTLAYEPRYYTRNPFFVRASDVIEVMNPTPIFRALALGDVNGSRLPAPTGAPSGFGPLTSTWMSLARGCLVYRGALFPAAYFGNVFVADAKAGVIHRALLRETTLGPTAVRAPTEVSSEFVISTDPLFHPAQIIHGPEGALYIADMRDGEEHGRIYRIVPSNFRPGRFPTLGKARTYDLVASLANSNGWVRDTAARLLYERHDPSAVPPLTNMLNNSRIPSVRLQALRTLDGLGALGEGALLRGLRDPDEHVREQSVRLSERLLKGGTISEGLRSQLRTLAGDPAVRVRQQLAFSVGDLQGKDRSSVVAAILKRDFRNPYIETGAFSSLSRGGGEVFANLAADARFRSDPMAEDLIRRLLTAIGVQGQQEEVAQVVDFIERNALVDRPALEIRQAFSFLFALGDGLRRNRSGLALVDRQGRLQRFYDQAIVGAGDDTMPWAIRVEAIRLLGVGSYTYGDIGDLLLLLYGTDQPLAVQSAGLASLARLDDARIATNLFARMQYMQPSVRKQAVTAVLSRANGAAAVLGALDTGQVVVGDLSPTEIDFLRTHRDPGVSQHAVRLFGPFTKDRPAVLQQARPALQASGNAARGKPIFTAKCSVCHRLGAEGNYIGPDLGAAKVRGKAKLLTEILAPNLELTSDYAGYVAETGTLDILVGVVQDQSDVTVTFSQPDGRGQAVWPKAMLQGLRAQPWSMMPEGLEAGLNLQGIADLLEYLMTNPR